jgi:tetratricopeptide (TPR) repeat protein
VLAADPADAEAAYLLASATALDGESNEAASLFARALALNPRQAIVTIDLARTLAAEDRRDEAIQLLNTLLTLDPPANEADAHFVTSTVYTHLGEIALEHGDVADAIEALNRALAVWPDNYDANNRLAFLLATTADPALSDPPRAIELATRACSQRREYGSLATLAVAYAASGNPAAAIDAAREALDLATRAGDRTAVAALEQQLQLYAQSPRRVSDVPK